MKKFGGILCPRISDGIELISAEFGRPQSNFCNSEGIDPDCVQDIKPNLDDAMFGRDENKFQELDIKIPGSRFEGGEGRLFSILIGWLHILSKCRNF